MHVTYAVNSFMFRRVFIKWMFFTLNTVDLETHVVSGYVPTNRPMDAAIVLNLNREVSILHLL